MENRDKIYYELKDIYNQFKLRSLINLPQARHIQDIEQEIELWLLIISQDIIDRKLTFANRPAQYGFLKQALLNQINKKVNSQIQQRRKVNEVFTEDINDPITQNSITSQCNIDYRTFRNDVKKHLIAKLTNHCFSINSKYSKKNRKVNFEKLVEDYLNTVCDGEYSGLEEMLKDKYKGKLAYKNWHYIMNEAFDNIRKEFE